MDNISAPSKVPENVVHQAPMLDKNSNPTTSSLEFIDPCTVCRPLEIKSEAEEDGFQTIIRKRNKAKTTASQETYCL